MRVLVLGAGGMGEVVAQHVARSEQVTGLVVADLDGRRASAIAQPLGGASAGVDALDHDALVEVFRTVDVVLNTAGPFYRLAEPVLEAALAARVHLLDVCDDWEPAQAMQARHDEAVAAGIVVVTGLGATPGLSNVLAVQAASALDEVDTLVTGWGLDGARPASRGASASAATVHGLHQVSASIRVWRDGRFVDEPPLRRMMLDYPGLGRFPAWTFGHPEAVTMPRRWPGLSLAVNVTHAAGWEIGALRALAWGAARGLGVERGAAWAERLEGGPPPSTEAQRARMLRGRRLPPLFVLATGTRAGRPASVGATITSIPAGGMGGATGVPLVVGFELLARGALSTPGVHAPEDVIDPEAFFAALAPRCAPVVSPDRLVAITTSWGGERLLDVIARG